MNGLRNTLNWGIIYLLTSLTNGLVTTPLPQFQQIATLDSSAWSDIVVIRDRKILPVRAYNSPQFSWKHSNAKERKENKENYQLALSDLDVNSWTLPCLPLRLEPCMGHWLPQSCWGLLESFPSLSKSDTTNLLDQTATKVISASSQIFQARLDSSWKSSSPLYWPLHHLPSDWYSPNFFSFYTHLLFIYLYTVVFLNVTLAKSYIQYQKFWS